jgi:hypothetical protein
LGIRRWQTCRNNEMKVTVVETYPGELAEKMDSVIAHLKERAGIHTHGCSCGCDEVSKAVNLNNIYKGEQSPFRVVRELQILKHKQGQVTHDAIIKDVAEYVSQAVGGK